MNEVRFAEMGITDHRLHDPASLKKGQEIDDEILANLDKLEIANHLQVIEDDLQEGPPLLFNRTVVILCAEDGSQLVQSEEYPPVCIGIPEEMGNQIEIAGQAGWAIKVTCICLIILLAILVEYRCQQIFLPREMIGQVAWTDGQDLGNIPDTGLIHTPFIEQVNGRLNNAISGLHAANLEHCTNQRLDILVQRTNIVQKLTR